MTRLLIVLLLSGSISYGQTTIRGTTTISIDVVTGDSLNNSPNKTFNDKIKLVQIDQSQTKGDIRLYTLHSLSNTKSVRRIYLVDTIWNAVEFYEQNKPVKIKKYKLITALGFDSLFLRLLSFNIMKLPDQSELKSKMHKDLHVNSEGDTTERKSYVTDGESYTIEIKIGDQFRVYQFSNPESYSKFYDNVSELQDYLNIVQTFKKWLKRK